MFLLQGWLEDFNKSTVISLVFNIWGLSSVIKLIIWHSLIHLFFPVLVGLLNNAGLSLDDIFRVDGHETNFGHLFQ